MADPTLTVVVPATNAPATLAACRAAIDCAATQAGGDVEVVVVEHCDAPGPAAARNAGAALARGDLLLFVDADVLVHPDAIARVRARLAAEPDLVAVFGSYDDAPAAPGTVAGFRNLLHHHVHQQGAGPAETFWAGLGAVRREAFAAAGGFDAGRYAAPQIEDVEFGMRLHAGGARLELDPALLGTHLKAWTLAGMVRTDVLARGVPWVALLAERRGVAGGALNLGWRHRISALASLGLAGAVVARRPRPALAAVAVMLLLNRDLYALLLRRRGPAQAAAGVGLHAVHHLSSAAAVPLGLVAVARARARRRRDAAR